MWRKMHLMIFVFTFFADSSLLPQSLLTVQSSYIGAVPDGGGFKPGETVSVQGIAFVPVPGGTFQMGSNAGLSDEQPVHGVTVSGFLMSRCEITQAQYQAVMGSNPAKFSGEGNRPVEQVSWFDAVTFCNKLSEMAGLQPCYNLTTWACDFTKNGYRLPTEAEWEYACRAGTATNYYTGDNQADLERAGWYYNNSGGATHAVGAKEANSFGLYDMHGNVWEWCNDLYGSYSGSDQTDPAGAASGAYRVSRGGSWVNNDLRFLRSAYRDRLSPGDKSEFIGFRIVGHDSGQAVKPAQSLLGTDNIPATVSIPAGTFQMGSGAGLSDEQPVHGVTVSGFQMSRCEITQAQYQAVMGSNPAKFTGDGSRPVEQVSWFDAVTFCNKLSEMAGLQPCYDLSTWVCDFTKNGYRLPTEAEWEYACRAGTATNYYTGDSQADLERAGWYYNNSGGATHAVGAKEANSFGLYDMHGNVWEWCNDLYGSYGSAGQTDPVGAASGAYRVSRGGSWVNNDLRFLRSTYRDRLSPGDKSDLLGFRVVRR